MKILQVTSWVSCVLYEYCQEAFFVKSPQWGTYLDNIIHNVSSIKRTDLPKSLSASPLAGVFRNFIAGYRDK